MREVRRPHRILMTADAVGGVWNYALTLAEALGERSEILLAVKGPAPSPAQRARAAGIGNLRLACAEFRLEWMPGCERDLSRAAAWLKDLTRGFQPDVLHLNGYAAAAERWDTPVLVVAHSCVLSWWQAVHGEPAPPEWSGYARRVARGLAQADCVVAPTRAMRDELVRHYGLPRAARVIANGCALERYAPGVKEPFVLAAGRFWDKGKDLAALDEAAARLSVPVHIAGDCRDPGGGALAPRAALPLGVLDADALAAWMARAAVYALPARYEPFGLSILEAAASGCAPVLGDIPSLRESWEGAALFVRPGDTAGLVQAITALLADEAERDRLAARAWRRARRFSAAAMAQAYAALYDELTGADAAAAARAEAC